MNIKDGTLGHNVLHDTIKKLGAIFDARVRIGGELNKMRQVDERDAKKNVTLQQSNFSINKTVNIHEHSYLAHRIEDSVEENHDVGTSTLRDVVQGLTRVISHARILIGETSQNRRHKLVEIRTDAAVKLRRVSGRQGMLPYLAQRNCRRGEANKPALTTVGIGGEHKFLP